jgi:mannose-6-phosphate isomerase-like protein (cupin superfamily)
LWLRAPSVIIRRSYRLSFPVMTILRPVSTYVHLAETGQATPLPGGDAFWSLPDAEVERYGNGWLVAEFEFATDWSNWEMHPQGDEVVYLLSGSIELWFERSSGIERIAVQDSGAVLVPRGVWHTAKVLTRSRVLHITQGAGTEHRSV